MYYIIELELELEHRTLTGRLLIITWLLVITLAYYVRLYE
jgi:hypothetical protein